MRRIAASATLSVLLAAAGAEAQVPAGVEFQVNQETGVRSFPLEASMDASGGFLVTWERENPPPTNVRARRYDPLGDPVGSEFTITDWVQGGAQPSLAVDARSRTVLAWFGFPNGLRARVFDASGQPRGPSVNVNGPYPVGAWDPSVASGRAGFMAIWSPNFSEPVMARRLDPVGTALGVPFAVSTTGPAEEFAVAGASRTGSFVVVWVHDRNIVGQRLDAAGERLGAEFVVNAYTTGYQRWPSVVSDEDGNFVVVWWDQERSRIAARRFDAAGSALGREFQVSSSSGIGSFSVAADRAGNFTLVWASYGADPDVWGQRFTAGGISRGAEFRINTATLNSQWKPVLADDGAGNLVVSWLSRNWDTGEQTVQGQRFGGIVPAALDILDGPNGNGLLEVGDAFTAVTSWRNVTGASTTFQGSATQIVAPAGLQLTLSPLASYATVANGDMASCGGRCFAGALTGVRAPGHLDATFLETIVPDIQGQTRRWRLHVGESFSDVPSTNPFYRFVETLVHQEVTAGCGGGAYCPALSTTRAQMSAFVLLAHEGAGYVPPACTTPVFNDVPASSPFCAWIEELARRGVTGGCGGGNYCPTAEVSREQMAVFVLRTLDPTIDPPACTTPLFDDVPISSPFCRWIEELARRGVVSGCGGGNYCPTAAVTREQMAVFLTGTFGLTLYGP